MKKDGHKAPHRRLRLPLRLSQFSVQRSQLIRVNARAHERCENGGHQDQ